MFEQAELQGTQMGPNGSPNAQKERLKSPQKSLIIENQAFWAIVAILARNCHLGHFGQPFPSQGGHADKKSHLGSCLNRQDRATCGFIRVRSHGKPGKTNLLAGVLFLVFGHKSQNAVCWLDVAWLSAHHKTPPQPFALTTEVSFELKLRPCNYFMNFYPLYEGFFKNISSQSDATTNTYKKTFNAPMGQRRFSLVV